jgi:hypothetical protein
MKRLQEFPSQVRCGQVEFTARRIEHHLAPAERCQATASLPEPFKQFLVALPRGGPRRCENRGANPKRRVAGMMKVDGK